MGDSQVDSTKEQAPASASVGAADILEDLLQEIEETRIADFKSRIRPKRKQDYLWLSQVHTCTRHNFYIMTEGDKRPPFDEYVQMLVESGNIIEDEVKAWLNKKHFDLIAVQEAVEIRNAAGELIGKGLIDGKIRWRGKRVKIDRPVDFPVEIKKMNPNVWARINTVDDLFKFAYTEKYVRQLLSYLHGNGLEAGFFLIDDGSNHWKLIPVYWGNHIEYIELMLRNMEQAFAAKKSGKAPERIKFNSRLCGPCDFAGICLPEVTIEAGDRLEDDEWRAHLERELEIKPIAKEYGNLHEESKEFFKKRGTCVVNGIFEVKVKESESTRIDKTQMSMGEIQKFSKTTPGKKVFIKRLVDDAPSSK